MVFLCLILKFVFILRYPKRTLTKYIKGSRDHISQETGGEGMAEQGG